MPAKKTTDVDQVEEAPDAADEPTLAWGTTAFEAGSDIALVARNTVGLIERDNPSTRERLWALVSDDAPLDDILDELSSTGLKALPDFGIAQVEGTSIRVVARGRATISAELSSGSTHEIDASAVRTWIEELVEDVAVLTIALPALDDDPVTRSTESFAVLAGSVPASSLTRRYDAPDDHADSAESGPGWTTEGAVDTDGAGAGVSNDVVESPAMEDASPAPQVGLEMVADIDEPIDPAESDGSTDGQPASDSSAGDSWFEEGANDVSAVIPPQPAVEAESAPADSQPPVPRPGPPLDSTADPEPAFVPADPQPAHPQPPAPAAGPSGPPAAGPGADSTVVVGSDEGPTRGPLSSIFDDDAAGTAGATSGDHDGMTVGRSELDGLQGDAASAASPANDSLVYGVLDFSNGERIDIDRAILIGRNPKVAGAVEGGLPHIMKFDGPGQGLSRTHAEIRVEGGEIIVEDLQSTNGTEVQLPGQQRRRLRGGEPIVIVPGTLIDFGDELHCTLESAN